MRRLKIRVFKGNEASPEATCTVPAAVLKVAFKLIPKQAMTALHEKGIELEEIIRLAANPEVHGTLLEVEDHRKGEKAVRARACQKVPGAWGWRLSRSNPIVRFRSRSRSRRRMRRAAAIPIRPSQNRSKYSRCSQSETSRLNRAISASLMRQ